MKKIFIVCCLFIATLLSGCNNEKTIDGVTYPTYGLFNTEANKNSDIVYEVSPGSVIVAVIFIETGIVPIYIIGWDLFQPVRKRNNGDKNVTK